MILRFLVSEDSNSFQKCPIPLLKIILTGLAIHGSLNGSLSGFRSQIALTGITERPMVSNETEEGIKNEIGATPKKRKKKVKDIETPSRKKVKKTSVKTEITD